MLPQAPIRCEPKDGQFSAAGACFEFSFLVGGKALGSSTSGFLHWT